MICPQCGSELVKIQPKGGKPYLLCKQCGKSYPFPEEADEPGEKIREQLED